MPCFMHAPEDTALTNRSQAILQLARGLANWEPLNTQNYPTNWNLSGCLPVYGQIEILLVRADRNFAEQIEIDCKATIEITAATAVEF